MPYKCLRSLNTVKVNLSKYSRRSIEVFLFHKSNTPESNCRFNCLPLSHLKILSYFEFKLPTATLMQYSLFCLSVSCNIRLYIIFNHSPVVPRYLVTKALKSPTLTTAQEGMLPTTLGFPKGKRVIDHYSILAQEVVGFSRGLQPS